MSLKDAEKEIQRLNKNKAFQNHDNSVWFNKENTDIFTEYFCTSISNLIINKPIKSSIFPFFKNYLTLRPYIKK